MKTCYVLLLFFLIPFLIPRSLAQKTASNIKSIYLEVSPFLAELQNKNNLLKRGPFGEVAGLGYGVDLSFGITNKNDWGMNIGVNFLSQEFTEESRFEVTYSNPDNAAISSNDFYVESLKNSFSTYDLDFTIMQLDGTDCNNPAALLEDGEVLRLNFIRVNPLQQIGVPIKLEKTVGKKRNKLYLGLGIVPIFVVSTSQSSAKYRQTNQIVPHNFSRGICYSPNGITEHIVISRNDLIFKNQNIKDFRLDLTTEFGLLNEGPKNIFKLTLFFNESLTGFSKVDNIKYQAQTLGVKFSLRKGVSRS